MYRITINADVKTRIQLGCEKAKLAFTLWLDEVGYDFDVEEITPDESLKLQELPLGEQYRVRAFMQSFWERKLSGAVKTH